MTRRLLLVPALLVALCLQTASAAGPGLPYPIVDTAQDRCFSNTQEIAYPRPGQPFYGQDAQYQGLAPAYRDNGDGTVSDLNTGLMWVKTPDLTRKTTYEQAVAGAATCRVGGYDDWRLPTIKELYSLMDFRGYSSDTVAQSRPYLDTRYFDFVYGNLSPGERLIDAQYWSSTEYVGTTMNHDPTVFGVNFADGRIKGYPKLRGRLGGVAVHFVRYVRGNPLYGRNDLVDNGDGTVTDRATGLMWTKRDSGKAMDWQAALKTAEDLTLAGHDDWRLPNAKELQSIVDYSRAPDATDPRRRGPAIDPVFEVTTPESWYWTSTTHLEHHTCSFAVYVCFGQAFGIMHGRRIDVHGAGAQRSDPKAGDPSAWSGGHGPQGDEIRILNYVRCVRGGNVTVRTSGPAIDGTFGVNRRPANGQQGGRPGFVSRLDRDGDGRVSRQEFDGPADQFDVLDRNHDGYLSEDEAPRRRPGGGPPRQR